MSEPLTDAELDAIEARANAATAGPWLWDDGDFVLVSTAYDPDEGNEPEGFDGLILHAQDERYGDTDDGRASPDDRAFIENARADVPRLVAEVRRLRAQVAGHCERIAAASEVLSRAAERRPELVWRDEPPTKPGWYWWRYGDGRLNDVANPVHVPEVLTAYKWQGPPRQWSGPLEPPGVTRYDANASPIVSVPPPTDRS